MWVSLNENKVISIKGEEHEKVIIHFSFKNVTQTINLWMVRYSSNGIK